MIVAHTEAMPNGIDHAGSQEQIHQALYLLRSIMLQSTTLQILQEIIVVVRHIVFHRIYDRKHQRIFKRRIVTQLSILVFKGTDDLCVIFGFLLPDCKGSVFLVMRIRYVKNVSEKVMTIVFGNKRDSFRTPIDPATESLIPEFKFSTGGRAGALSIDEHLIIEGILVHSRGAPQECLP